MAFFIKKFISTLYVADDSGNSSRGFVAFIIPPGGTPPVNDPELSEALTNTTYQGIFVFSSELPVINSEDDARAFYNIILKYIPSGRSINWVHHINDYTKLSIDAMGISDDGSQINAGLQARLDPQNQLLLNVPSGMNLSLSGTVLQIDSDSPSLNFSGGSAPVMKPVTQASLDFSGDLRGCICFQAYINRASITIDPQSTTSQGLMMGFQFLFPDTSDSFHTAIPGFFSLVQQSSSAADFPQFTISIDPTDAFNTVFTTCSSSPCTIAGAYHNRRTYFDFTGVIFGSAGPLFLSSCYSTVYGATVNLFPVVAGAGVIPARLVLCQGESTSASTANIYLAPEGDFAIQIVSNAGTNDHFLMCGMQGTEFFQVSSQTGTVTGDTLRYISGSPALAPGYPFQPSSPVGPPQPPNASLLSSGFTTSWVTIVPTSGNVIKYVSQPKGSSLFGNDPLIAGNYQSLFGHTIPGFSVIPDDTNVFPLIPYLGAFDGDGSSCFSSQQIEDYEKLVISPVRRKQLGILSTAQSLIHSSIALNAATDVTQTITTPSGLLVTVTTSGDQMQWNHVLLGQNTDPASASVDKDFFLQFINPDAKLIEALQTSDLFLVAANADYIPWSAKSTQNIMSIGGWGLQVNVGANPGYGDYKNVIIVKGKKGKLFDTGEATKSLVANPDKWTQRGDFAAPTVFGSDGNLQPADTGQLVNLSQWLQTYFQEGIAKAADKTAKKYFEKFKLIAEDENWTGILFLRLDIQNIPGNLSGIVAGVTDTSAFNAHHLAVDISPVKKKGTDASLEHPSTMYGLIYYVDPDFIDADPYTTLAPTTAASYDFRLLTLKVLFENTAVKSFESYAQLTIRNVFGTPVQKMGDPENVYDNILLKGSFQINGGNPVYNLSSEGDNLFYPDSNIIKKVEITNAVLLTGISPDTAKAISLFALSGFMDYYSFDYTTKDKDGKEITVPFDLFSFGNKLVSPPPEGQTDDAIGKGLAFNNLGIQMTYAISNPSDKTFVFNTGEITFDIGRSTPRPASLFTNFALDEVVLISGGSDAAPSSLGYLSVIPDMRLSGVDGSEWYGLKFLLNLGTPGELAGKVNLNAYLLLVWSPDSKGTNYLAGVMISLPGTGGGATLISLQNVLKLSIGQIRLLYDSTNQSFLMLFTEIALKFLGLLKIPPNGSTLFYLFGNPNSGGKASGLGWYAMYKKDTNSQQPI